MINLKKVTLHEGLLVAGVNLGKNLEIKNRPGLLLQYDEKKELLLIWFKDQLELVPRENIAGMGPINITETKYERPELQVKIEPPQTTPTANLNIQAQVSTPHSHVFANEPGLKVNR